MQRKLSQRRPVLCELQSLRAEPHSRALSFQLLENELLIWLALRQQVHILGYLSSLSPSSARCLMASEWASRAAGKNKKRQIFLIWHSHSRFRKDANRGRESWRQWGAGQGLEWAGRVLVRGDDKGSWCRLSRLVTVTWTTEGANCVSLLFNPLCVDF